jgi:hypothetical protein
MVDGDRTNDLFGTEADHPSLLRAMRSRLRGRMLAGLLLVLPFVITAWIVISLYRLIEDFAIRPIARLVVMLVDGRTDGDLPLWFANVAAPLIGMIGVLALLYFLGFLARSKADRILDAILHRIPIVTSIHKAVRQLFAALGGSGELTRFKRVVLVEFPHPGMRPACCSEKVFGGMELDCSSCCMQPIESPVPACGWSFIKHTLKTFTSMAARWWPKISNQSPKGTPAAR